MFDEDLGLVYEAYTAELVLVMCMMKYYTDLDMTEYEGEEGWYTLYDILESNGVLDHLYGYLAPDLEKVKAVYATLRESAAKTFQHKHSLDFLAKKSFGSLLSTEDITQTIAQASDVNNTMVALLDSFAKVSTPDKLVDSGLLKFARKDIK